MKREGFRYLKKFAQKAGRKPGNRGFALVVVMVVMLLASFLASELILRVRTEQRIAFNVKNKTTAHFLSEAGVNLALFRILEPKQAVSEEQAVSEKDEEYLEFLHGQTYETFFNKGKISYYAINESGKIDLNRAPRPLLELFLEYHGVEPDQIATIIDSLLDWRDTDNLHRLNGAEQETYEELDDPYIPRNGVIEDPAEFALIYGADVVQGKFELRDVFTVHNVQGKINFNSLTPAMLDFVMEGDAERIEAYRENQKLYGTFTSATALQVMGEERFDSLKPYLIYSAGANQYYCITAIGQPGVEPLEEGQETEEKKGQEYRYGIKIEVLVRKTGSGFDFVSWRENYA